MHQRSSCSSPLFREYLQAQLEYSLSLFLQCYPFPASILLLRVLIPFYSCLVEMISNSKSFIIQLSVALIILLLASSLTSTVNAAAISRARQFFFLDLLNFTDFQPRVCGFRAGLCADNRSPGLG